MEKSKITGGKQITGEREKTQFPPKRPATQVHYLGVDGLLIPANSLLTSSARGDCAGWLKDRFSRT